MPKPTAIATTNRLKRLVLKSTAVRMRAPVAATMPNMTRPAPPSTTCGTASTKAAIFGRKPRNSIMPPPAAAPACRHPARADAGDADEADILRKRRVGEGVEEAADHGPDAVGAQAA